MDTPLDELAIKLAETAEARKSTEILVRMDMKTSHPSGSELFNVTRERYIETTVGERFYEQEGLANGVLKAHSTHYMKDGKAADVMYAGEKLDIQASMVLSRRFWMEDRSDRRQLPIPLLFDYVGRSPLHEALKDGKLLANKQILGRNCVAVFFPDVRWISRQDQVFYIDAEKGVPLKVEAYRPGGQREPGNVLFDWTAKELAETADRHPYVKRSTMNTYSESRVDFSWEFEVESMAFDKSYPASTFWPATGPGVAVTDTMARKMSTTPGENPAIAEVAIRPSTTPPPIDAGQPSDWSIYVSRASIVLGLALLASVLIVRFRSR